MLLTGHEGAVYSISFDPTGQHIASGSFDNNICKLFFYYLYHYSYYLHLYLC